MLIARAIPYDLGGGREVRLCTAEDLVIHRALAGRPQDGLDELARGADDPEVRVRFERAWAAWGPGA